MIDISDNREMIDIDDNRKMIDISDNRKFHSLFTASKKKSFVFFVQGDDIILKFWLLFHVHSCTCIKTVLK